MKLLERWRQARKPALHGCLPQSVTLTLTGWCEDCGARVAVTDAARCGTCLSAAVHVAGTRPLPEPADLARARFVGDVARRAAERRARALRVVEREPRVVIESRSVQ